MAGATAATIEGTVMNKTSKPKASASVTKVGDKTFHLEVDPDHLATAITAAKAGNKKVAIEFEMHELAEHLSQADAGGGCNGCHKCA